MSEYKGSPKPFRKSDPSPLFKEADDGYLVKALSPIQRQRKADGTPHSARRPSSVEPKDYDLFIGEDKLSKASLPDAKSVTAQMKEDVDPDDVIKAYMASGTSD